MRKLSIMVLTLFFICFLIIPAYSDTHYKDKEGQNIEQINSESDREKKTPSKTGLEGRKVTLKDGSEVVIVDVPDSLMKKTKVHFDEEGKPHVSCH